MALNKQILIDEIRKINDESYEDFIQFPENIEQVASRWSDAIDIYTASIIPISTTRNEAKVAFKQAMKQLVFGNGFAVFKTAFSVYANTLSLGMSPIFTGVSPTIPITLESISVIGLSGGSAKEVATAMAIIIDSWFKTGIATNTSSGISVNWN